MADFNNFADVAFALKANITKLSARDQEFGLSLLTQFGKGKALSEKQTFWMARLAERATGTEPPKPAPQTVAVADGAKMAAVIKLFETARQHLKHPAVRMMVPGEANHIRLSVAGPNAKRPGTINVAEAVPFGTGGNWYGRITLDGTFEKSGKTPPTSALVDRLNAFACNPAGVASEFGKLTGVCCFCSKPLSDPKSTAVGYGAICASHYGLPWGETKTPAALAG